MDLSQEVFEACDDLRNRREVGVQNVAAQARQLWRCKREGEREGGTEGRDGRKATHDEEYSFRAERASGKDFHRCVPSSSWTMNHRWTRECHGLSNGKRLLRSSTYRRDNICCFKRSSGFHLSDAPCVLRPVITEVSPTGVAFRNEPKSRFQEQVHNFCMKTATRRTAAC